MKVGALDLGTNTFLCLIAEVGESGIVEVLQDLSQIVRLGQDIDRTGEFSPQALQRARVCLETFKQELDRQGVKHILAMATSAARDARNGQELFDIGKELNIPIEIIPGVDEARITYQGATAGLTDSSRMKLVIDIGGGSTELIQGHGHEVLFSRSLDIGAVRLTERFITKQPVLSEDWNRLENFIDDKLNEVLPQILKRPVDELIAVAGTPTAIASLELGGFVPSRVDDYQLSVERLRYWVDRFAETSVETKRTQFQLGGRADVIFAGSLILLKTVEAFKKNHLTISIKGVRYGVALEMYRRLSAGI